MRSTSPSALARERERLIAYLQSKFDDFEVPLREPPNGNQSIDLDEDELDTLFDLSLT